MYINQAPQEIDVPGVQTPINIAPAQTQLTNVLIYLAVAAALLMLYRRR
jgi:hypothetical protein